MNTILLQEDEIKYFENIIPSDVYEDMTNIYFGMVGEDGRPVGVIAWKMNRYAVEITYVYVEEEFRCRGIGTTLINQVTGIARKMDSHMYVMASYVKTEENGGFDRLIRKQDAFAVYREGSLAVVEPEDRNKSQNYLSMKTSTGATALFFDTTEKQRHDLYEYLLKNEIGAFFEEEESLFMKDISLCTVDGRSKDITSCILFKQIDEKNLELAFMMMKLGHEKNLVAVIGEAIRLVDSRYPDYRLYINTVNNNSEKLLLKVFEGCRREDVYSAVCFC